MPNDNANLLNVFQVEDDLASYLHELDAEELSSFISLREDTSDEGLNKAATYAYFLLFEKTGSTDYLRKGIAVVEEWLDNAEEGYPSRVRQVLRTQLNKANGMESTPNASNNAFRKSQNRPPHDLDSAISDLERQWHSLPDIIQGQRLSLLGTYLDNRYQVTDWLEDLDNAIRYTEMAACLPCDNSTLVLRLTNLGAYYGDRYKRAGSTKDIDRALELIRKAIELQPDDVLQLARSFTGLAAFLGMEFERFGNEEVLNEAVQASEMAVAMTPDRHPELHGRLNDLSNRLSERFNQSSSEEDLFRAIKLLEQAMDWKDVLSNHDIAVYSNNLSLRLYERFRSNFSIDDLNRAVELGEKAVALGLSEQDPDVLKYLNTVAMVRYERFAQVGDLQDLDGAIEQAAMAVRRTPRNHPEIVVRIMNWGCWLRCRGERTGSLDDVTRAIDVMKPVFESLPSDHLFRVALLNELSNSHSIRHTRTSNIADLELGLRYAKEAFEFRPRDHHRWAGILNNYANLLGRYAAIIGSADYLAKAIENMSLAIKDTPTTHQDLSSRLCNLGDLYGQQFRNTGSKQDIHDSITATEKALDHLPREHTSRAKYLVNLGTRLTERYNLLGRQDDQRRALSLYEEGSDIGTAAPSDRVILARRAGTIHASCLSWNKASIVFEKAVDLLPSVSLRSLKHTDKQDMLGQCFGLASDAAAASLNAGNSPYHALQLLERGRGVIAGILMDMRGDPADLQREHPDLAEKLITLRDQLASQADASDSFTSIDHVASWDDEIRKRRVADQDLNELIQTIRAKPGFKDFLLLPSETELLEAAKPGPIVIINTSRYRCDAFLIESQKLRVLNLPELKEEDIEEQVKSLRSLRSSTHAGMKAHLNWLWDTITGPCLDALGYKTVAPSGTLSRVWWVPTGLSSQLPLHAAGNYRDQPFDSVLDRTMSSYALSVKSLIHGRVGPGPQAVKPSDRGVLISMKHTPGLPHGGDLDFAEDEVRMLKDMCAPLGLSSVTPKPFKDDVFETLKTCKVFHFAGHGNSDPTEPSKSCLLLEDWQTNPLTVGDFRDHHLRESPPFLGYLSACSTGANSVAKLADEGIHLINSLQLAGFRHVVGTLWEVSDRHCVDVAKVFYKTLQVEGLTDLGVCQALHKAIKQLRDGKLPEAEKSRWAFCLDDGGSSSFTGQQENFHWVPYVHFGS
ncbi:hypothetical protein FIE12Z_971 [Fusarium flagelliforme]|uniref:CHAT domain-containing protein n=1 Tax=Fusarium flagelliforme TaxID=2675880 RepID=A0A395N4C4_9HYPO|nr:hypothetical protein FIE12Z_971 [Fusarium flagelliforme]